MSSTARPPGTAPARPSTPPVREAPAFHPDELIQAVQRIRDPLQVVRDAGDGRLGVATGEEALDGNRFQRVASLAPLHPEWLGDRGFLEMHGVRFPYLAGAMANGITTPSMVIALARAGMLGFYGAAGLPPERVEAGLDEIESALGPPGSGEPWGSNLIHNLHEPEAEAAVVDLYLRRDVRRVSASAFMSLTLPLVRYACSGLTLTPEGRIRRRNHVFAKISRPEVARLFASPAPAALLRELVATNRLTPQEAELAAHVPLAEQITVEADSGGHTDNRPLTALFPTILKRVRELSERHGYDRPVHVGAAGGLGTPSAVAAAFGLGAAYVLTGSVNQAATESGLSAEGRRMLAAAALDDVGMAPSADMFELGVKVQVLKRGTMFGPRADFLLELYRGHSGLDDLPERARGRLEREILRASIEEVWQETRTYFMVRDPSEIERAEADPRHRMALVFRWYLGNASRWAVAGETERRVDYQIWCGPAMGAFNAWVEGSFLEAPENRSVVQIARNLMEGAAVVTRSQSLRACGVPLPPAAFDYRPRPLE
jgi:trans-AT polyketide synthase, acyltransferase and oxidoreductase domains